MILLIMRISFGRIEEMICLFVVIEIQLFRKHGRYMTKNGFVDSSRRVRSLHRQQDDITPTSRSGLFSSVNKSTKKPKTSESLELPSVISISTNLETKKKEHDKQMRLIEVESISFRKKKRERILFSFYQRNKWLNPNKLNENQNVSKVMWKKNNDI